MSEWIGLLGAAIAGLFGFAEYARMVRKLGGWQAVRETGAYRSLAVAAVALAALAIVVGPGNWLGLSRPAGAVFIVSCASLLFGALLYALWQLGWRRDAPWMNETFALRFKGLLHPDSTRPLKVVSPLELRELRVRLLQLQRLLDDAHPSTDVGALVHLLERDMARVDEAIRRSSLPSQGTGT